MYHVSEKQEKYLKFLGFKPDGPMDEINQYDWYEHKNEIWAIGGCYLPARKACLLAPSEVYEKGRRLTTIYDLIGWLENRLSFEFEKEEEHKWQGALFVPKGEEEIERIEFFGESLIELLYNMICGALEMSPQLANHEVGPWCPIVE